MPTPLTDSDKVLRNDTGKDIASKLNLIAQALGVGVNADQINYDNTESGLTADNAQEAIDEIKDITDDLDEKIDDKTSYESTASGSIVTFNDGGNNIPMKSCEVAIVAQQTGSGTPSPDNERAIIGFDEVDVVDCGINQWDEDWESGVWNSSGNKETGTAIRSASHILLKPSTTYFCYNIFARGLIVRFYDANKNITRSEQVSRASFTTNANEHYITINTYIADNITTYSNNISINYPSTETQYHAYKGTTTPVSLGQTIYGGTAELVGGNGVKTYDRVDLSTLNWIYVPSVNVFYADNDLGEYRGVGKIGLCEIYDVVDNVPRASDVPLTNNIICGYSDTDIHRLYCRNTAYTDATQFKNSMVGKYLVYKLATPTAFTFTGATIPTLSGVNNVYADSGDVDLEYFNFKADQLADLIRAMTR